MNNKTIIRLNERDLHRLISESVKRVLNESMDESLNEMSPEFARHAAEMALKQGRRAQAEKFMQYAQDRLGGGFSGKRHSNSFDNPRYRVSAKQSTEDPTKFVPYMTNMSDSFANNICYTRGETTTDIKQIKNMVNNLSTSERILIMAYLAQIERMNSRLNPNGGRYQDEEYND